MVTDVVIAIGWVILITSALSAVIRHPSAYRYRIGILLAYVAFVAALVWIAIAAELPPALSFGVFFVSSLAFAWGYMRLVPWRCMGCETVNEPRATQCVGCGITRGESEALEYAEDWDGYGNRDDV